MLGTQYNPTSGASHSPFAVLLYVAALQELSVPAESGAALVSASLILYVVGSQAVAASGTSLASATVMVYVADSHALVLLAGTPPLAAVGIAYMACSQEAPGPGSAPLRAVDDCRTAGVADQDDSAPGPSVAVPL